MDMYGNIVENVLYPLWLIKNKKTRLYYYLKEFEKSQFYSLDQIQSNQFTRLKFLLNHAYSNSPFYQKRLKTIGLHPNELKDFNDYTHIPVLKKEDIQNSLSELVAQNFQLDELIPNKTGGSTGKPLTFYHDFERVISMDASTIRHNRWAGYNIGDKLAVIWGHHEEISLYQNFKAKMIIKLLNRQRILDSSHITEELMAGFVKTLRNFKPEVILAYANSLYEFAKYCQSENIHDIGFLSAITSAEVLHEHERKLIENVFTTKIFDRYGCREVSLIASECDQHKGLHINADALYVEFVNDSGEPAKPGELANVLITDLYNLGMPFIRYQIEDVGILSDKECSCGRGLPLMKMVGGRVTDFLVTPEGTKVSGASLTIFVVANTPGVVQAQFIQEKPDFILLKIVKNDRFNSESKKFLSEKLKEYFGPRMVFDFQYVDNIPKEPSGKYRFSISNLT